MFVLVQKKEERVRTREARVRNLSASRIEALQHLRWNKRRSSHFDTAFADATLSSQVTQQAAPELHHEAVSNFKRSEVATDASSPRPAHGSLPSQSLPSLPSTQAIQMSQPGAICELGFALPDKSSAGTQTQAVALAIAEQAPACLDNALAHEDPGMRSHARRFAI